MKVTSIPKISGYRIFKDFCWKTPLEDFRRYNLIFGPNASGKTTLSSLFQFIQDKKPLPAAEGEVSFAFDGTTAKAAELDQHPVPEVRVFNRDTVKRSVFEDATGELPPVYYLGEDSAEKKAQVAGLKEEARKCAERMTDCRLAIDTAKSGLESFCIESARSVKNLLTASGGAYNNYDKADLKNTADRLLKSPQRPKALDKKRRETLILLKSSTQKPSVPSIALLLPKYGSLRDKVGALLQETVASHLIDALVNEPELASWVNEGLKFHQSADRCKFCDQPLPADRVKRLEEHFNDRFRAFQADLEATWREIEDAKELLDKASPSAAEIYDDMATEYADSQAAFNAALEEARSALRALQQAIQLKKNKPFARMEMESTIWGCREHDLPDSAASELLKGTPESLSERFGGAAIAACNAILAKHNLRSANHAKEVSAARKELEEDEVLLRLASYSSKRERVHELEMAQAKLRQEATNVHQQIGQLEGAIQSHRGPAKELTKELAAYLGNSELTFEPKETGYSIKRCGQQAMNLSEGERTAIAFLYFLKSLGDTKFNLAEGVVVIDDPVSSLDANSLYCAFGYLHTLRDASSSR